MYDYVIVGAGSAGCVVANRLGEDPDVRVAVIEAGPPDDAPEIHMPAGLRAEPHERLGLGAVQRARARAWTTGATTCRAAASSGGSSSLNAMIYIRGNRADYDEWAAMGFDGWGYDDVLPYFKRAEDNERGAEPLPRRRRPAERQRQPLDAPGGRGVGRRPPARPASRPTRTSTAPRRRAPGATRSRSATAGAAAPRSPICTRRPRAATSTSLTDARVYRILFEGKRAVGVEYMRHGAARAGPRRARGDPRRPAPTTRRSC